MLTKYLLPHDYNLYVVEADTDMVAYLFEHYPPLRCRIIEADFLKLDLATLFNGESFRIIGNFPYNISSQIVFKMIEHQGCIPEMVGMFQREMARRIVASPGSKDYGVISVLTQARYEGELLFEVGSGNFYPRPKVESAVIRLWWSEKSLPCEEGLFRKIVKQAFSQRRKMLRNTMKAFIKEPGILEEPFFTQRPEMLSVDDFANLTLRIAALTNGSC